MKNRILISTFLCAIAFALCVYVYAETVTLRFASSATVNDTCIRLGDVASVAGVSSGEELSQTVIGSAAPAGYNRRLRAGRVVSYVLSSRYPSYEFTVTGAEVTDIATAHTTYSLGEFVPRIARYIRQRMSWDSSYVRIEVYDTSRTLRVLNKPCSVTVTGLSTEYPRGNEQVTLLLRQQGNLLRVPCRVCVYVQKKVLVAAQRIPADTRLEISDVTYEVKDITHFRRKYYENRKDISTLRASRSIAPGEIISDACMEPVPVVEKGRIVQCTVSRPSLAISVKVRARENGRPGDRIWVQNIRSNKLIKAEVINSETVKSLQSGARL